MSWPHEVRQAVEAAVSGATAVQRRLAAAEDDHVLAELCLTGNDIARLTEAERAAFVEAVAPVREQQQQAFGGQLFSYFEAL
jgi:TRAP-type C4-dicarboxylate transport system substrate-binding protein